MALSVVGNTKVFRNEKTGLYSIRINKKDNLGNWSNLPLSINFKKGVEIPSGAEIIITNGFLTFYESKTGEKRPSIMVMEYEIKELPKSKEKVDLPF